MKWLIVIGLLCLVGSAVCFEDEQDEDDFDIDLSDPNNWELVTPPAEFFQIWKDHQCEPSVDQKLDAFKTWLTDNNADISKLSFESVCTPNAHTYRVSLKDDADLGTPVFHLPDNVTVELYLVRAWWNDFCAEHGISNPNSMQHADIMLAVYLAHEISLKEQSLYAPWLALYDSSLESSPYKWVADDELMEALDDTALGDAVERDHLLFGREIDYIRRKVMGEVADEDMQWLSNTVYAFARLLVRASLRVIVNESGQQMVSLMPLYDLLPLNSFSGIRMRTRSMTYGGGHDAMLSIDTDEVIGEHKRVLTRLPHSTVSDTDLFELTGVSPSVLLNGDTSLASTRISPFQVTQVPGTSEYMDLGMDGTQLLANMFIRAGELDQNLLKFLATFHASENKKASDQELLLLTLESIHDILVDWQELFLTSIEEDIAFVMDGFERTNSRLMSAMMARVVDKSLIRLALQQTAVARQQTEQEQKQALDETHDEL